MRSLFVAGLLCTGLLSACAEQHAANACFVETVKEAGSGNFSRWVLPDFIGGTHLRAGQYLNFKCEVVATASQ